MLEETFALTYCMEGMVYRDVEDMASADREWFLDRLHRQLKAENEAIKSAGKR